MDYEVVHRRTGGLEKAGFERVVSEFVHRRTGGLEKERV